MSDPVQPHRWQPTRLPHPWDSPGKNTGVRCHFLLQFMKVKRESEVTQSCPTLSDPMDCSPPGSSVHGFSRQEDWSEVPLPSLETPLYPPLCLCVGEGDGTTLQYSCLENAIDGGAWWAAVHGVAKSPRLSDFTFMHWRRKWHPTPVFLPGESQGRGSLVGCRLWGRTESDTTEAT